jgi:hypothetical protein
MPDLVRVTLKLDNSGFNAALAKLRRNSRSLPSSLVNRHVRNAAWRAYDTMPKVNPGAIDQELEVERVGVTKAGKLSKAKNPRHIHVLAHPTSLASLIVLASFYELSKFNVLTGKVWERSKPNTKGTEAFWQWMAATSSRMVKARRSSTGFYRACAGAVWTMFKAASSGNLAVRSAAMTGMDALPGSGSLSKGIGRLAGGTVAVDVGGFARASFWVSATEPDTKGERGALFRIAQPVWQRAIDAEAAKMLGYAADNYTAAAVQSGIPVV